MEQSKEMNIHSTIAKIMDHLIRNPNPPIFCYSYYKYNNEQHNQIQKIINSNSYVLFFKIITYNTYCLIKTIFSRRIKKNKKVKKVKNLIYFENSKYLDVVDEISSELVKSGRNFNKICGKDIRKDLMFFNRGVFNEILSQILIWNSIKIKYNSDVRKVLNYIFFKDLLYISLLKINLKSIHLDKLYTTNYISEISLLLGAKAKHVVAFKRGITGIGPELSCVGVDSIFVKDEIENKLFKEFRINKNTKVLTAFLYSEIEKSSNLDVSKNFLLYLTQPTNQFFSSQNQVKEIHFILELTRSMDIKLLIKPHPSDKFNYKDLTTKNDFVIIENSLTSAINNCKYAITKFSGTGLDVIKQSKLLILLDTFHTYPIEKNYYTFADLGLKFNGDSVHELSKLISSNVNSKLDFIIKTNKKLSHHIDF
jgi:hypothetical protein